MGFTTIPSNNQLYLVISTNLGKRRRVMTWSGTSNPFFIYVLARTPASAKKKRKERKKEKDNELNTYLSKQSSNLYGYISLISCLKNIYIFHQEWKQLRHICNEILLTFILKMYI